MDEYNFWLNTVRRPGAKILSSNALHILTSDPWSENDNYNDI